MASVEVVSPRTKVDNTSRNQKVIITEYEKNTYAPRNILIKAQLSMVPTGPSCTREDRSACQQAWSPLGEGKGPALEQGRDRNVDRETETVAQHSNL